MPNLKFTKEHGIGEFLGEQKKRIELLETMLNYFDEGRSKSFYCLAAALLPITDLEKSLARSEHRIETNKIEAGDIKTRADILRELLEYFAAEERIQLKLRKKMKTQ